MRVRAFQFRLPVVTIRHLTYIPSWFNPSAVSNHPTNQNAMKQLMRAFLVGALCLISGQAMAQGLTLSGVVTDQSTGEPLPAVNIFVPSLNRGAVTDVDGNY